LWPVGDPAEAECRQYPFTGSLGLQKDTGRKFAGLFDKIGRA
jgi:hypothetical protein